MHHIKCENKYILLNIISTVVLNVVIHCRMRCMVTLVVTSLTSDVSSTNSKLLENLQILKLFIKSIAKYTCFHASL